MAAAMKIDLATAPPDKVFKEEEFGLKLHNTVKVRNPSIPAQHSHRVSVLAANNIFGLIAVGTDTGVKLYKLSDLTNADTTDQPKCVLDIQTGCAPQHVCFNCDGTLISISVEAEGNRQTPQIFVYNILEQKPPACIAYPTNEVFLLDLAWNPVVPTLLSVVYSDMKVRLCKVEGGAAGCAEVKLDYQATCLSWSPKGKQLAIGTLTGHIVRVDQSGKTTFTLPAAPNHSTLGLFGLFWQSTYTYLAAFGERTDIHNFISPKELSFMTIKHGKDQPVVFTNYSDIWLCSGTSRVNMMLSASIAPWDMLVTMVSNAMDAALLTHDKTSNQWEVAALDDTTRISVPMSSDDNYAEHFALGLTVSFNSTAALPLTDTYTHPPCPVVCVLSTNGSLLLYHAINRLPGADHSLVKPPQPVSLPTSVISTSGTVPKSSSFPAAGSASGLPPPYNAQGNQGATSMFSMQPKSTQNAPAFGAPAALAGMSGLTAKSGQGLGAASVFGAAASQGAASTFGGASSQSASSLFGAAASKGAPGQNASSLFGAAASQDSANAMAGKTGQTSLLFGAVANQGTSAFGGKPASSFGAKPSGGFGDKTGLDGSSGFAALAAASTTPADPRAEKLQQPSQPQQVSQQLQQPQQRQLSSQPPQPPPSQPQQPQQAQEELDRLAVQERLAGEERNEHRQMELQRQAEEAAKQEAEKVRLEEEKVRAAVELKRQTEAFYNSALQHEADRFNKELDELRKHIERPVPEIISRTELREMRSTISDTVEFSREIKENVQTVSHEIHSLRLRTLDSLAHLDQMETLYHKSQDPQYRDLINARPLDPRLSKLKQSIEQRFQYLKQEVLATDTHLDELWLALHQDRPRNMGAQTAARTDVIYRTLATIERIIAAKRSEVDGLAQRLGLLNLKKSALRSADLNSSPAKGARDVTSSVAKPAVKKLSNQKAAQLRAFLSSRTQVPVVKSAPINLKAPTFDPEASARKLRQMTSKLSPAKPAQPSTSSKMAALPHRDKPRKVTQNQPAGLTHPIASRAEVKQPVKELGGVSKPVASKISQPTPDLPTMPGVKSAFNVPADTSGYQAGFAPVLSQPSGAAFAFNKPSTSSAGVSPNNSSGGAKPPGVSVPSGSKTSVFTAVATPPADPKTAGISTTPVGNHGNKQPVARSLGDMLSSSLKKEVLNDEGDPDASSTFPQGKSVSTSVAGGVAINKPGSLFGGVKPAMGQKSAGSSLFSFTPKSGQSGSASPASLFAMSRGTTPTSAAAGDGTPVSASPKSPSKGILGGALPSASPSCKSTTASVPTTAAAAPSLGFTMKPTQPSSQAGSPSLFAMVSGNNSASGSSFAFNVPASTATTAVVSQPPSTSADLFATKSSTADSPAVTPSSAASQPTSTAARSLFGPTSTVSNSSSLASILSAPLAVSATNSAPSMFGSAVSASTASSASATPTSSSPFRGFAASFSKLPATTCSAAVVTTTAASTAAPGNVPATATASSAAGSSTSAGASGLFGGLTTTSQSSLFGGKPSTPSSSLFGASNTPSSSLFGGAAATTASSASGGAAATTASSLFGAATATTASSAFGGAAATTASSAFGSAAATTASSLFGAATATTASSTFGGAAATTASSFFGAATATTASSAFGGAAATTASSAFGGASAITASPAFGSAAATTASTAFGGATATTASSAFGGATATTASSAFGGAAATTASLFGGAAATTASSTFGGAAATTASLFGGAAATTASSTFGGAAATTASSTFGGAAATTASSAFGGAAATTASSAFGGAAATTASSAFGGAAATTASSAFGGAAATTASSAFGGAAATTASSAFGGAAATTASSAFGGAAATTASSAFGGAAATTASSAFSGTTATTASLFGGAATPAASASSAFGVKATPSASSIFGGATATTTASSLFGKPTAFGSSAFGGTPATTSSSVFGGKPSSAFGGAPPSSTSANLFGGGGFGLGGTPDPEKAKQNPFGKSAGSTPADSAAKNLFGNAKSSPFGTPAAATGFGNAATGSSPFGGAATSASSGPFGASAGGFGASSAFGTSTFGAKPAFGGAPSFGVAPALAQTGAFGAKPTFGSPAATFGSSPGSGAFSQSQSVFGAAAQQDLPTFGSLAGSSDTPSFGSVASPSQPGPFGQPQANAFGSPGFGQPQQQASPFGAASSPLANSSFSSYRS